MKRVWFLSLALGLVLVADVRGGPLLRWLRARRGASVEFVSPCVGCVQCGVQAGASRPVNYTTPVDPAPRFFQEIVPQSCPTCPGGTCPPRTQSRRHLAGPELVFQIPVVPGFIVVKAGGVKAFGK